MIRVFLEKEKNLKHMKKWSTSLIIREVQITTTLKYHFLFIRLAKLQDWKCTLLASLWGNKHSYSSLVGMQNGTTPMEGNLAISSKMKMYLQFDQAILLLRIKFKLHLNIFFKISEQGYLLSIICTNESLGATHMSINRQQTE